MRALYSPFTILAALLISIPMAIAKADGESGVKKQSSRRRPKIESVDRDEPVAKLANKASDSAANDGGNENSGADEKPQTSLTLEKPSPASVKPKSAPVISPTDFADRKKAPKAVRSVGPSAVSSSVSTVAVLRPTQSGDPQNDSAWNDAVISDARPSKFQSITPGQTTMEEVIKSLGEPDSQQGDLLTFRVGPFPKVEITFSGNLVRTIVIHLDRPTPTKTVRKELALERFRPADVVDARGNLLGQAYPERGIAFSYAQLVKPPAVAHIMLEPINAEMFMLRARENNNLQERLADARYARRLLKNAHETYYIEAQVAEQIGRIHSAHQAIEKAIKSEPETKYELIRARLRWKLGEQAAAVSTVRKIANSRTESALNRAAAACELGDMIARGKDHNYHAAFEQHMKAIKLVDPLLEESEVAVRRSAKLILIHAHLGVSTDLAWGEWRRKEDVIPQWTSVAQTAVDNLIDADGGGEQTRLIVLKRILQAYAGLNVELGQDLIAHKAIELGRKLIELANDPLSKRAIHWELAEALYYASRNAQRRQDFDQSIQLGENAAALMETASKDVEMTSSQRYLAARVKFQIGSIYALDQKSHDNAIPWYDQSIAHLKVIDSELLPACGAIGDRLVSMGVSYWQSGKRERAVTLTRRGAELLEIAVESDLRKPAALGIPYSNLASMHEVLGDDAQASKFAKLAKQHQDSQAQSTTSESNDSERSTTNARPAENGSTTPRANSARNSSRANAARSESARPNTARARTDSTRTARAPVATSSDHRPEEPAAKPPRRRPAMSKKIKPRGSR